MSTLSLAVIIVASQFLAITVSIGPYSENITPPDQIADNKPDDVLEPSSTVYLPALLNSFSSSYPQTRTTTPSPTIPRNATAQPTRTPHPAAQLPPTDLYANCVVTEVQDDASDNIIELVTTTTYNDIGNPVHSRWDYGGGGISEGENRWKYDSKGNLVQLTSDDYTDDSLDETRSYYYDNGSHITRLELDFQNDGSANEIITFDYDVTGHLQKVSGDKNADGVIDRANYYHYDDLGRRVRWEYDANNDGTMDSITTYAWENTLLIRLQTDNDADGIVDNEHIYYYDNSHRLIRDESRSIESGIATEWKTYYYNANDLLVKWELWLSPDYLDQAGVLSYDEFGRPTEIRYTHRGLPDNLIYYQNNCS